MEASPLPIQRRAPATPSPLGNFHATPLGATSNFRLSPDGATFDKLRRWADYTPTATGRAQDNPTTLWPPTPSPMGAVPLRTSTGFGIPESAPYMAQGPTMTTVQGVAPGGQVMWMQMPQQMQGVPMTAAPMATLQPMQHHSPPMMQVFPGFGPVGQPSMHQSSPVVENGQQIHEPAPPQCDVTHLAGRQLFGEALDSDILDNTSVPAGPLPSPGSAIHGTGRCNPCAWFWKARGCQNGQTCTYCHLCPEGELKNRKKAKVVALRMGAIEPSSEGGLGGTTIKLSGLL